MWKVIIVSLLLLAVLMVIGWMVITGLPDLMDAMIEIKEKWQELKRMGGKKE